MSKAETARLFMAPVAAAWLFLAVPAAAQQAGGLPPPAPEEKPEDLPDGKGREETFYACVACHGSAIIRQQGMTRDLWDQTLTWMTEKHGMAPPDADERKLIVEYLATAFPPRRRGRPNPFLQN
ncbi:MAG: cytochrome C-552 [Rhodospirillales bacterium]